MLSFQIESQLRRRIVQELELLVNGEDEAPQLQACSVDQVEQIIQAQEADIGLFGEQMPAALIELSSKSVEASESKTKLHVSHSRLIRLKEAGQKSGHSALATSQVPLYDISAIFGMPPRPPEPVNVKQKGKKKAAPSRTLRDLATAQPEIYERELIALQGAEASARLALAKLGAGHAQGLLCVPVGNQRWTPLLISLWRWRMWIGEGWSGDGFGMLEATGRRLSA
jgi:hypothetical protein